MVGRKMNIGDLVFVKLRHVSNPVAVLIIDISKHKKTWHRIITIMSEEFGLIKIGWKEFYSYNLNRMDGAK